MAELKKIYSNYNGQTPSTGKEVEDAFNENFETLNENLVQLAGETVKYVPLTSDPRFKGLIDCFYGSTATKGVVCRIIQMYKSTGRIILNVGGHAISLDYGGMKEGVKLHRIFSGNTRLWILVNWDAVISTYDPNSEASFVCDLPHTVELKTLFAMLTNGDYSIKDSVVYNEYEMPQSFNCTWSDGTDGTVLHSNFDSNVLEFKKTIATYGDISVNYGEKTFDINGNVISQNTTIIW